MGFTTIIFEKKDGVAYLTLNRPEALNALSPTLISEMRVALDDIEGDETVRAVVIAAKGKAFCAGMDLKDVKGLMGSIPEMERVQRSVHGMFNAIEALSKVVICAVQGMALAGGLELLQACDIVIASEDARIGDQHANFGLIPGGGDTQRLPRIVGIRKAKEILLTGDWLSAAEAERIGLVNKVVPADKLEEAVDEMVKKVTKNKSPLAARTMKYLVNKGMQVDLYTGLELEIQAILNHFRSEDVAEGLRAFEQKRAPVFKGR